VLTESIVVGDLLIHNSRGKIKYAVVLDVRDTDRPSYGKSIVDNSRKEFKIWTAAPRPLASSRHNVRVVHCDSKEKWIQDVEIKALWKKA